MRKLKLPMVAGLLILGVLMGSAGVMVANNAFPQILVRTSVGENVSLILDKNDLTVPDGKRGNLEKVLEQQNIQGWPIFNVLKLGIRQAVSLGVSPNTLVVLFLFPLVAALVSFSRQMIGINGFGIITPALLSVAFLSTGAAAGMVLLTYIMLVAMAARVWIKKIKVPYLPKLSILIWALSLAVMALLVFSPWLGLDRLVGVGIFPILLFVLLSETFVEAQITRSPKTSMVMTLETVVLALVAYKIMSAEMVQSWVLLNPELSVVFILLMDYWIGRYSGLRLMEVWRFRKMLKK